MRIFVALTIVLGSVGAFAEESPHLVQARAEMEQLRYDAARASLEAAVHDGKNGPGEMVEIARCSAEVAVALGDIEQAELYFRMWVALAPDVTPSEGISPKIRAGFEGGQKWLAEHGKLSVRYDLRQEPTPAVALVVESDPLELVTGARIIARASDGTERVMEAKGHGRLEVELPVERRWEIVIAALDQYGNRLVEMGRQQAIVLESTAQARAMVKETADREEPGRPIYGRWWFWGGAAAATGTMGIVFGLLARSAANDLEELNEDSTQHDFQEAKEVEDRGRRNALLANVSFVLAAGCGVAAAVLGVREWRAGRAPVGGTGSAGPMTTMVRW